MNIFYSGTPIQNSIKDLWSLVNFLQISPFTDRQWWTRAIERPLEQGNESAIKYLLSSHSILLKSFGKINCKGCDRNEELIPKKLRIIQQILLYHTLKKRKQSPIVSDQKALFCLAYVTKLRNFSVNLKRMKNNHTNFG